MRIYPAATRESKPLKAKLFVWNMALLLAAVFSALLIRPNVPISHAPLRVGVALTAAAVGALVSPPDAEARRFGGGRSFGLRGSRGFSRGFSRKSSFGRRSTFGRGFGYRRGFGGFAFPFFMGMGLGGFGFGLMRMLFIPLILFFVLRMMSARRY
jgi:uncharacterized membrane protein